MLLAPGRGASSENQPPGRVAAYTVPHLNLPAQEGFITVLVAPLANRLHPNGYGDYVYGRFDVKEKSAIATTRPVTSPDLGVE